MLPRDQYTYYAFSENSKHYAQQLKENIHSPLAPLLNIIYKHTYSQAYPAVFKYFLEDTVKWSSKSAYLPNPPHNRRGSHDEGHAAGTAVASVIFFKLYEKYGTQELKEEIATLISSMPGKDGEEKRMVFIKLLQIATAFHDAGRLGGGADRREWEKRGANDCHLFILTLLKNSHVEESQADAIAKQFSQAIFEKDQKIDQNKPLLNSFVQCADCLEIMRCKREFLIDYLDIWQDAFGIRNSASKAYIAKEFRLELQKELLYLTLEWRELLLKRHRLKTTSNIKARVRVNTFFFEEPFLREDPVNIASKGIQNQTSLADPMSEFDLCGEHFSFLRKYYEFSDKNLGPWSDDHIATALKPIDDAIHRYVEALNASKKPEKSIDKLTIAFIDLRQTLKEQLFSNNGEHNPTTNLVQNETIILIEKLIPVREKQKPLTESESKAIENYHQKLAHLLNNRQAKIAAAIVFTILTATLLTLACYLIIPAVVVGVPASLMTLAYINCYMATAIISLPVAGISAFLTYFGIANNGLGGKIKRIEDKASEVSRVFYEETEQPSEAQEPETTAPRNL